MDDGAFADARYRLSISRDDPGARSNDETSRSAYVIAAASAEEAISDGAMRGSTNTNARRSAKTSTKRAAFSKEEGNRE